MEQRLLADNPDLAAAYARHTIAAATVREAGAARLPSVDMTGSFGENRQSDNRPLRGTTQPDQYGSNTLGATATYEVDLWRRVGDTVKSARAKAEASADDAAAVRLSLEADLASTWIALRGADAEIAILADAVAAYGSSARITRNRFTGGIANGIDLGRADAQLADAQAQLAAMRARRAMLAHAVAALAACPQAAFRWPRARWRCALSPRPQPCPPPCCNAAPISPPPSAAFMPPTATLAWHARRVFRCSIWRARWGCRARCSAAHLAAQPLLGDRAASGGQPV
jgi:hypothetical protein